MVNSHSEELRKDLVKIEVKLIKSEIRVFKIHAKKCTIPTKFNAEGNN